MAGVTTVVHSGNPANRNEHTYYGNGVGTSKTETDLTTGRSSTRDWYVSRT